MFYRLNGEKIYDFADYKYDGGCLETDIITARELENDPLKVVVQNGELILNPDYEQQHEQQEKEKILRLSLTKREVFLALYDDKGITPEQLRSQITDVKAQIEFDYAEKYYRFNPLINQIGTLLGYTPEELDYLFINKEFPPKSEEPEE